MKGKTTKPEDMPFLFLIILSINVFSVLGIAAQTRLSADSISRNTFLWNQKEKEFGFRHFDKIFRTNDVENGKKVFLLPRGEVIAAFSAGGKKEKEFETFIMEQKVAGILIIHEGKIRLERYALGFSEQDRWTSQSVAKSVTSTLVGAAMKDGYIKSLDDPLIKYIPDLKGSAYDKVTIRQLLTMTTGVKWNETYTDPNSDIAKFYTEPIDSGINETVSYMRHLPSEAEPGKKWVYKTGETHLLGVLVSAATGKTLSEYLSTKIWAPFGMEGKATWNIGRSNQEFAGCCLQMKLRDSGRFGQFILGGAQINGKSIVPDDWLAMATRSQVELWPGWGYGFQWWTLSDGTFRALGIHGQMIHIDKKRQLVVVLNSVWPEAESFERQMAVGQFLTSLNLEIDNEKNLQKQKDR
jgi:CubicO group peptidase (beta-lactamase class C family)